MAFILSGLVLVLPLLCNPSVSISIKGSCVVSSFVLWGSDNDGGTAAGLGDSESWAPSGTVEGERGVAPSGPDRGGNNCVFWAEAPLEDVVVVELS